MLGSQEPGHTGHDFAVYAMYTFKSLWKWYEHTRLLYMGHSTFAYPGLEYNV